MEPKEASRKLRKFFSKEEKKKRSFKSIAEMIKVSHVTLYKKIKNNNFSQWEINILISENIISTNPQPKWKTSHASESRLT